MTFGEFRPLFGTTKSDWNFEFACSPSVTPEGDDNRSPSVSRFVTSTASSTPSISEIQTIRANLLSIFIPARCDIHNSKAGHRFQQISGNLVLRPCISTNCSAKGLTPASLQFVCQVYLLSNEQVTRPSPVIRLFRSSILGLHEQRAPLPSKGHALAYGSRLICQETIAGTWGRR